MRLSTSNSEGYRPESTGYPAEGRAGCGIDRWSILLIFVCAGWLILVESVTAVGFHRLSRIQGRIHDEYLAAVVPTVTRGGSKSDVLLIGNSLLNAGIDMHQLITLTPANWQVKRLVIESTTYMDWYYGLRRLFQEGARPDVVCLMLSWQQLAATEIRGEYFAHYLMLTRDFFGVVHDLNLPLTAASNLLVGRFSAFYSARVEIRKFLLSSLLLDLEDLTALIVPPRKPFEKQNLRELATSRFRALKRVAGAYRIPIVFILAPTGGDAHGPEIEQAGQDADVPVVIGWSKTDFPPGDFIDGFHLNSRGAQSYTNILAAELKQVLKGFMRPGDVISTAAH